MIIKLSLQSKEYLRDLEIFVRFRLHSSYPLREICDVTKTERKECHESYNHLVHLRNPETKEKWRLTCHDDNCDSDGHISAELL